MNNDLGLRGLNRQVAERRQASLDAKEQGEQTCDVYPFSCEVTLDMVSGIKLSDDLKLCRCLSAVAAERKERAAAKAKETERRESARFGALPPALSKVTFSELKAMNIVATGYILDYERLIKPCEEYSASPYEKPLLTIFGPVGSGKTSLAAAIVNARGMDTVWAYIVDLLKHLQGTFGAVGEFSYAVEFQRIVESPLLVLDDLGAEKTTEWARQELDHIITHRHMYRLPTVITTNLDMTVQTGRIGSRLRDWQTSQLVRLEYADRRLKGAAR